MRNLLLAAACLSALATGAARAGGTDKAALSSRQCGLSTPYNVQVDGGGVWLYRREGAPQEIFFHDGTLSVDHRVQAVSAADAQRLRRMEDQARALMPQVAGIARESAGITFDALSAVMRTMTGSERKARKVERHREQALASIDASLGKGRWDQDGFGEAFEANVEQVAREMAASLGRSALWAVFTGRADRLEERSDRVDREVDAMVDARTAALERQAQAMCTQVVALRAQQDALEYRYRGAPLVMLEPDESSPPAAPATTTAEAGTVQRDGAVAAARK